MTVLDVISRIAGKVHLIVWHQSMPIGYSHENAGIWNPNEIPEMYYNYQVSTLSGETADGQSIINMYIWKEGV